MLRTDSHNGFTWMMRRTGIFGLFVYLNLIVTIMRRGYWLHGKSQDEISIRVSMATCLIAWAWIIAEMAGNVFKDPQLMLLIMISAGWLQQKCKSVSRLKVV